MKTNDKKRLVAGKMNKPTHYKVIINSPDLSGSKRTYQGGYTGNPKIHMRESKKEGWKKENLDYVAQYKKK